MDVDVFEHGWEHLPDYKSLNSNSSREGSSTTLSPSLQSYLDVNSNNHPSWPSSSAFSPYQQQNPTCIRRVDIARTARRHGPSWARKRGSGSLYRGATSLGPPSAHAAPGPFARSIGDGRAGVNPNTYLGRAVPLSAQFKDILERGWDGRMALGRRTGGERRLLAAHLSASASAPCFEEKPHQYLAAPKSWDNPRMGVNTRSAGSSRSRGSLILRDTSFPDPDDLLGRGADQTGSPFSIRSGGQMQIRRPRTAPVLQPPRLSPSGRGGRSRALSRASNGPDPGTMGLQNAGGGEGFDGLSRSGFTADRAPSELSRSLSPPPKMGSAQTTNRHLPPFTSYSFGPSREHTAGETTGGPQPRFVTVRALSLLPCGSIGQEVAFIGMSPFDSVRSLRAAIHTDIDRNNRPTIDAHHGGGGSGGGGGGGGDAAWGSSPAFLFSYADGVPIDRGQEGRLSVQDIAIASSSSRATNNADDPRGGEGGGGRRSAEACVFLRACSYRSNELETGGGGSVLEVGVLGRWGSLQGGGSCGNEAFPLDDSAGSPEHLRSNAAGSLSSSPVRNAISSFHGGSEEMHWSVDGREETGLLNRGGGGPARGTVVNVGSPQRSSSQRRRISVSFDESKAARRQRILEQVERLAATKATTIAKVCRGHQARVAFRGRLDRHRKALTIQLCSRRWSAKLELQLRARRRDGAVKMQALVRSYASRRRVSLRRDCDHQVAAATRIQCNARKMAARQEFASRRQMRRAVVVLQCWARLKAAKKRASSQAKRSTTPGLTTPADSASVATAVEKQETSVTDKPSLDELLSAKETTHAVPRSAQGPLANMEEGGAPVTDAPDADVVLAAEATAHEVAPSAQGSQAETLMAAAAVEEGEVLQKGATPGKERSAVVMEPFDTVTVGAEEPDVDDAGRDNIEPERVTPEDTGAVNNTEPERVTPKDAGAANAIVPLAAEERAIASDGDNLNGDAAPTTESTHFTAHEKAPPDEEGGAAVVGSPAAAVPDGDLPDVVGESRIQQGVDNSGFVSPEEEPASVDDVALTDSVRPDHDALSTGPCESTPIKVIETMAAKQLPAATVGETGVHQLAMEREDASTVEKPTTNAVEVSVPVLTVEEGVDLTVAGDSGVPAGEILVRLDGEDEGLQGVTDGSEGRPVKTLTPEEGGHDPITGLSDDAVLGSPSKSDEGCALEANDALEVPADQIAGGDDAFQPATDGDESLPKKSLTRDESKEAVVDPVLGGPSLSAAEVPRMVHDSHDSDAARPISGAAEEICATAIEDSAPSGTPNGGSAGDVGCLNLEPEHETSTADINLDSPSLGDPTPPVAEIVAKDVDAAQFTSEMEQDSPPTSAKDEARMDASTSEEVAAGDAITTVEESFVISASGDLPLSAMETVGNAEDTGALQLIPAATQETLAAAIEDFSPVNAKDNVLVDGSALEGVAPEHAIMTAEEPIVAPASPDDPLWSAPEVVGDAGDAESSQPTSATTEERTVAEVKDNTPVDVQDGTSAEKPASEIAVPESASTVATVATEGATSPSPVFCGTTGSMRMVADAEVDVPNPVVGDETLVVMTEDSAPEVVPGGASACEPVPIAPVQEHMTPAAGELAADPVWDDPTTSAKEAQTAEATDTYQNTSVNKEDTPSGPAAEELVAGPVSNDPAMATQETPTVEAADTSQLTTVNTEDTLVFAMEENAHSAVRDGGSGGELAPIASPAERITPKAEGSISLVVSGDPTSAVGETLEEVEAAEFAKPTSLASKEVLVTEIEVSTTTNTKDQATADGPATMTPVLENMIDGVELPGTVPVTDDVNLAGTEILRTVEDTGVEQSTPIAEEEMQLAANQMSASIATDGALSEQLALETAAPESSAMVPEEKEDTSVTVDPILSAAEAPELVGNIYVEQSSVLGAEEVLASAVVNHVSTVSLEEGSAYKPTHTTSPLEHITPTAERFDAVSVTDEPPLGLTETVGMSTEEVELGKATLVTGEETVMATRQLSTTNDVATDGVSAEHPALETTSLELGSTIAKEKLATSATGDLGVSATEALGMESNADVEQPLPAGTGVVLEGEVEANTHAIVPDQALDDESTHLSRSLAYVTPAAEESIAVAITGDPRPMLDAETLGKEEDADIEEPTPVAGEDMPSLAVEDSIPRDVPVDWPAEQHASIVPALERVGSPGENSVAVPVSEDPESSVAETLRVEEAASFDVPPRVAGGEALVASVEAMDGASSVSEHVTVLVGEQVTVPTMGDPAPPVGGEFGMVNDTGGTQSNRVGAEEIIAGAIEVDPPIVPSDDASAAEPDYSLPALVDVGAVAKESVAVSVTDESTSLVKKSPGQAEETDIEQPTPGAAEERETVASAVEENASAIVLNLVSADEPPLEAAAPEIVTSVAEEFVTVSVLGDRSLSIAEESEMEGGVDVAQPNHADAEELVAGTVEVGTSKVVVDNQPILVTPSPKDAASAATGSIAVPVAGGPSLAVKETLEMVEDAGIGQANLVAEEETLMTTLQPDALTDTTDATLIVQPDLEIATPEHIANTSDEQVTVPDTNYSCLPATEKLDKGEDAGAGQFTPLAEEVLVASEANAVDDVSAEQPPVETPALEHSTNTGEEHADALATSEPEFPGTEALGKTEDAGVEQPNPVVREENVVAATEQTVLLVDPDSVLTEQPAPAPSALKSAAPGAEEPVPDPVTDNPILPEAATSGMEEGSDIDKSTSATRGATPVESVEASVVASATGGLSAGRSGSDTAVVEHIATISGAGTDAPATSDPISSATEALGATGDVDNEQPTPVGAEETLTGGIEETAPTFVLGGGSADEPASVAAPSECIPWVADESVVVPIVDGPSLPAKDNVGSTESLEVDKSIAVPEQEMLGATMEQSPATVVLDGALGGDISSATSSPMHGSPAELGASSVEAPSVATPVMGDPTSSAAGVSEVEENADVEEPTPVTGESALVAAIEDSSAPAIVLEEILAETIASGVSASNDVVISIDQPVAVPVTGDPSLSVEEALALADDDGVKNPTPAATGETLVAVVEDSETSTEKALSKSTAPNNDASVAKDYVAGPVVGEHTLSATQDLGQAANGEVAQPALAASEEALGAATQDCDPTNVLNAACTEGPDSSATPAPEHEVSAGEETIDDPVPNGFTSPACDAVGMAEGAEVAQPAGEAAKKLPGAVTGDIAPAAVMDAALATEDGSMTAAPTLVAPAAEETVQVSVSGGPTPSVEALRTSEDTEVKTPAAVAEEENLVAELDTADSFGARGEPVTEESACTGNADEAERPATDHSVAGQEVGDCTSSLGEPLIVTAEDAVEAPTKKASVAMTEDTEAQHGTAETAESQRAAATTLEAVSAGAPAMTEGNEGEKDHPVAEEQTSITTIEDSAHIVTPGAPTREEIPVGSAAQMEDVPEIGEPLALVLAVDGGGKLSVDESLAATMGNDEEDETIAANGEAQSAEALSTEVAKESSASVDDTEVRRRISGTGGQAPEDSVEATDTTIAADEATARGLSPMTSPEVQAGSTSTGLLASPVADDATVSVFEASSLTVDGVVEKPAEILPASMTEGTEAHQIIDGSVEGDTAEVFSPGATKEVLGTIADTHIELPQLVAEEETAFVADERTAQTLVHDGFPTESPAPMAHAEDKATAGEAVLKTPATEDPFMDQTSGNPSLCMDETSAPVVDNAVNGSADKAPVEVVKGVDAHEASAHTTEDVLDEASTPKDNHQLSLAADDSQIKESIPVGEGGVSDIMPQTVAVDGTATVEPGFMAATEGEASPVAEEPVANDVLGGPTLSMDDPPTLILDACGDASVDKPSVASMEEDNIQEDVTGSTQDASEEVLTAKQPALVTGTDEPANATIDTALTPAADGASAKELCSESPREEEQSQPLKESRTQPVSDGSTPSVDAASALAVDPSIDMVVNTSTMAASEEGELPQAAADSAEGRSAEVVTPEVAVDSAPEILSTPAQEEVVPVAEELPADEVVANDEPATAGDTESERSYPVHGEEATVAATENVVSTIQGGSITEEPASVSDIPQEEELGETQPVSDGPTPSVDASSALVVDASIDMVVDTPAMVASEEGELSQAAADSAEGGSVEVVTPEVAAEIAPEIFLVPTQEEVVPVAEELPTDVFVANDAPGTTGDTENEMSYPVHGEEAKVAATENVVSTIQNGSITEEPASVSDIPQKEALGETQAVSDGPTPSVDASSSLTVDASIDMVEDTPTMVASEEGELSQAAADSAEGGSVEMVTPEAAVEISPEVLSTPAQEEEVPVDEELPTDVFVANDAPGTAGNTDNEMSYPVNGEETTSTTTENIVSTIQGGSITEGPASVSDIPQEETLEESRTQPVSDSPTPSVHAAFTLAIDAPNDMVVNTSTMEAREEGDFSQAAADSVEGRSVEVTTPEVAVDSAPEVFSTPAQEEVVPVAEELPVDEVMANDAPATAGDTESEMSYPVNGEEAAVAVTENVVSTIQGGSITEEPASVSDIPQEEALEETQPVSDGPTPSVDASFTLTVDASIDMVEDTPAMVASEEGELSQAAADSAEGGSVEVITPEVAAETTPEVFSTPAQENVVTVAGELPADVFVTDDAPETAGDTEIQTSDPVNGEETTAGATTNIASTIQGGSITEEPASVSDIPQEEASTSHEPLTGGFLAAPASLVDDESALFVGHNVDVSTNNAPEELIEGDETRQVVTNDTDERATGTPTSKVATEAPGKTEGPEAGEVSPTAGGETSVAAIRECAESVAHTEIDISAPVRGEETPVAAVTDEVPSVAVDGTVVEEPAYDATAEEQEAWVDGTASPTAALNGISAVNISSLGAAEEPEAPKNEDHLADFVSSDTPLSPGEASAPILAVVDDVEVTDTVPGAHESTEEQPVSLASAEENVPIIQAAEEVNRATADKTTLLSAAEEDTTSITEDKLARGVPGDPAALIDDGSLAKYGDVGESADKSADDASMIVGEGGEGQRIEAGMQEGAQVDAATPGADDHALATVKGTEPDQPIPQEPTSTAAGSDEAEPRAEDAITGVVSRGSTSLSDGTSVAAEIGTAEVSVETPLAVATEDVGQRKVVVGAVEGELAEVPTAEDFASVNAAADTEIDMLAPVRGEETPVAMITDKVPSVAVGETAVVEPCRDAIAEEQEASVDETTAPTAALNGTPAVDPASLNVTEEQEAPNNEDLRADIVSSDTPLSLGEASAPILDVVDAVEDTVSVHGADQSTAGQPISLASAEENVPIVPAAEDSLADTVSGRSNEFALGSADEAFRDVPLAATVSKEEVHKLPVDMTESGRAEVLIIEATGEATMAENGDGVESAPTGGEDAFVSVIEGRAPIVTHGEGIADKHAPFNTEEKEAAPTTDEHLAGTVFGGPAMLDGEAPVIAADGAMDTLQDKTLGNSIAGGTADKPVEEQSPEVCVEAPVYADNAEVENRSVLVSDHKPGLNHGEDNPSTSLDDANADKPNCEAAGRQSTQEAQEASTELVETTTEQPAPMLGNGLSTPNVEDTLTNEHVVSVAGEKEAGDVSDVALQAGGVGSGGPDSAVNEAPELISDHADDLPAEQVRGNASEDDSTQRAVGLTRDDRPIASVEGTVSCSETGEQENMVEATEGVLEPACITTEGEALDDIARAETSTGGSILMVAESGGVARDAQRAEKAAETAGKELMAADGSDLRQEGAQENSSANGVPIDKAVNGTEEQEENRTDLEEARPVNTLADELLDEALPLDTEQCASSIAQPTDGLDEQLVASTVGGGEEKHAVDCVAEGKTTDTLTSDVIEKDSPTVAESTEGTERPLSSKEDIPGSPSEGETPSFVSGKVAADDPASGFSGEGEEEASAPEENQGDCIQAELTPSANEEVSLAISEHAAESTETATAAGSPLAEDSLVVAPGETLLVVDQQVSKGTGIAAAAAAAAAAEEIDVQQPVGETTEGELMDVLTPEAAKVEEASDFSGGGDPMNAINNSAPTDSLDGGVVNVPLGTTELEAEESLVAEKNLARAAVNTSRSSAEQAAVGALTVDEAVKTSPDEGMAEVADEGEILQTMAITGDEDSPVATMTPIDTDPLGVGIEIPADGTGSLVQNVGEATAEEVAGETRATVLAASETEHLSSDMIEGALIDEGVSTASPTAERQVSIDESNDAGEEHEVRIEKPIADAAGLRPTPADEVVAADQDKDNPAPQEERMVAGGEDHPISPPPPEVVQAADVIIGGDEEARSAKRALVDEVTEVNVVGPTLDVLAGQDTESIVAKEQITPPMVLDAPPALEAREYVPTAGESGDEGAEQTAGVSVENAEVAQPTNLVVEGLTDEASMAVNVSMKQEEGLATRVEDYRPKEAIDSGAGAPEMENDADQSGPVFTDDGVALEDRGNAVEEAREESAVTVAEPLDKTREEAPATPQTSDLNVGAGGTLSVGDIVSLGDEGGSVASIAGGEDKVLAVIPGGSLKPTSETIEDETSEFFVPEGTIVPEPVSMDVDAVASMGDEDSVVFPAVEAAKQLPLVPDSETARNEEDLVVEHEGIPAHETVDDADTLEAGVEQAVPVPTKEEASVAAFDAVLSNEIHLERVLSGTATFTQAAKENIEEEAVNKTPEPLVVRDEIDHEVDQLVVTSVGDGLKAKDEEVSSSVVELGTREGEPTSVIDELRESAEVVPVAAEIVHVDNPSSADVESGTTARDEKPAPSTSEQAQSSTTSEGVGASLAVENISITGIGDSTLVSVDDKADVATTEQPQKQAATSTSNESLARTSDEPTVGLPPGTNVTLEDDEAREETASAAEREDGGGHTLPNAVMEEQNEGLPADEATGVTGE